jgi:NAD(P)H-hydrate repair Nnr-like enzyme with NAD(P)H-hydrate epimerase domain
MRCALHAPRPRTRQVLEWTGQDAAHRALAKHRGQPWSSLPHGAKKALLAAADALDWSFLGAMAQVRARARERVGVLVDGVCGGGGQGVLREVLRGAVGTSAQHTAQAHHVHTTTPS